MITVQFKLTLTPEQELLLHSSTMEYIRCVNVLSAKMMESSEPLKLSTADFQAELPSAVKNEVIRAAKSVVVRHKKGICETLSVLKKPVVMGLVLCAMLVCMSPVVVYATGADAGAIGNVFNRVNTALQEVLRQIRIISSVVAALFLTITFLMMMFSKNQRTVDESRSWMWRILIAWGLINGVGFLLHFVQGLIGTDMALPTIAG